MLQDALGIAFCLYMLKTVRLPTFKVGQPAHNLPRPSGTFPSSLKLFSAPLRVSVSPQACTLLLTVLFVYDVFFVFITPFLTRVRQVALPFTCRLVVSLVL